LPIFFSFFFFYLGTPEIHVTWYLDGNEVTDQAKYGISFIDGLATLKVTQARVPDSGIYVCEAHNDAGSESCKFSPPNSSTLLSTFPSFLLVEKLKETPCVLGSSALLECKVSGSPPISVAWFQNGHKLVSGEKYQISFSDNLCILEVNSLSNSDTGTYTCKATNIAGADECSAVLTVQGQYMRVRKLSELFFSLSLLKLPLQHFSHSERLAAWIHTPSESLASEPAPSCTGSCCCGSR
uniref:Ig-like domain-containing protein n=1 Tax=Calidris pygmaea TaxID=425635 RepID=A0A8C3KJK6_9CHAR